MILCLTELVWLHTWTADNFHLQDLLWNDNDDHDDICWSTFTMSTTTKLNVFIESNQRLEWKSQKSWSQKKRRQLWATQICQMRFCLLLYNSAQTCNYLHFECGHALMSQFESTHSLPQWNLAFSALPPTHTGYNDPSWRGFCGSSIHPLHSSYHSIVRIRRGKELHERT